jgi:adenosylhomocysteine nucleosidase
MNAECGVRSAELNEIFVCFAVKEEAHAFQQQVGGRFGIKIVLTGIGRNNAERALREALVAHKPGLVLSCGFAGGLRPELTTGTVLFAADGERRLEEALLKAGARAGRFCCAAEVAITSNQKRALWERTRADAVEMESEIICAICRERKIPHAIVRVILDTASEDLPLDFNLLMTADQQMSYGRLAMALVKSPGKIGALLRLQKQSQAAAQKLAEVLLRITI